MPSIITLLFSEFRDGYTYRIGVSRFLPISSMKKLYENPANTLIFEVIKYSIAGLILQQTGNYDFLSAKNTSELPVRFGIIFLFFKTLN